MVQSRQRAYISLKHWREAHDLSQEEAARILNVTQGHYSKLENGRQYPGRRLAKAISDRTRVPIELVLGVA